MINKRGQEKMTVGKAALIILGIIVLILLILGVINGWYYPLYEKFYGKADGILVMVGLKKNGNSGVTDNECFSLPASFKLENGKSDSVTFEHCFKWNGETCTLKGFNDGSEYYYYPSTRKLTVKRKDTGYYNVDVAKLEASQSGSDGKVSDDEVYYQTMVFIYSLYGVDESTGRREPYDTYNYMKYNIDDDFGTFGDMLILYGKQYNVYFMYASGRYLVFDKDTFETQGLGWWDRWWSGYEPSTSGLSRVTPIMGARGNPDWALYSGNSFGDALNAFKGEIVGWDDDDFVEYVLCSPDISNSIYHNCYWADDAKENGSVDVLLWWIYDSFKKYNPSWTTPKGDANEFDRQQHYDFLEYYVVNWDQKRARQGLISGDSVERINRRLQEKGNSFEINGQKFVAFAEKSYANMPRLVVQSEDGKQKYFFEFDGYYLYQEGNTDFFYAKGNQIRSPFSMRDSNENLVDIDRTFSETEDENFLNAQVFAYFKDKCP